jgi:hypothetical protein
VRDCTGPAVTSAARDALGVPVPSGGDPARGRIRPVGLAVVADSSWRPKVMETRGVTIAVRGLLVACVGHRDCSNDGWMSLVEGLRRRWWSGKSQGLSRWGACGQEPLSSPGPWAHLGERQRLVPPSANCRWCIPVVDGDRPGVGGDPSKTGSASVAPTAMCGESAVGLLAASADAAIPPTGTGATAEDRWLSADPCALEVAHPPL